MTSSTQNIPNIKHICLYMFAYKYVCLFENLKLAKCHNDVRYLGMNDKFKNKSFWPKFFHERTREGEVFPREHVYTGRLHARINNSVFKRFNVMFFQ